MERTHNNIRPLREANNLTLTGLSKKLEEQGFSISPDALGKYERGDREPKLSTWSKIANYFGVSVSFLQGFFNFMDDDILQFDENYHLTATENTMKYVSDTFEELKNGLNNVSKVQVTHFFNTYISKEKAGILTKTEAEAISTFSLLLSLKDDYVEESTGIIFKLVRLFKESGVRREEAKNELKEAISDLIEKY